MEYGAPKCNDCKQAIPEGGSFIMADHGQGKKEYCLKCNRKLMDVKDKEMGLRPKDDPKKQVKDANSGQR